MSNEFARNIQDAGLNRTKALPAAGADAYTDDWDFGADVVKPESVELEISVPATPNHTLGNIVAHLVTGDSASPTTETGVALTVPYVATTGGVAKTGRFRLPSDLKQYNRIKLTVPASDGDNTAVSATAKLLF